MKNLQLNLRLTEEEKKQLLLRSGKEKLSKYLLRRGLSDEIKMSAPIKDVLDLDSTKDDKIRVGFNCDTCGEFRTDDELVFHPVLRKKMCPCFKSQA